jgi:4-hydroxy-tetrahydrodipicolinate synthase
MRLQPFGIIPAMATPFRPDGELNEDALRKLTQHLIRGGVHGLFATGSQGEFWALTPQEKQRVWEIVLDEADGELLVYAGTGAVTTREVIDLNRRAEAAGVDAVSVITPFFVRPTEPELETHYRAIAEATSLPILLYNNPGRTGGVDLSPSLVARLAQVDNIVGIKDSSGDLTLTMEYVRLTRTSTDDGVYSVVSGRDTLILSGLLHGTTGAIAATANVVPELVVDIYEAFELGDLERARRAQERLAPLRVAFGLGSFPVVVKEALELIGIPAGPCRGPVGALPAEKREELRQVLRGMGV